MAEKVEYTLSLNDLLTGKIREADKATEGLEKKIEGTGISLKKLGGIAAGVFAGFAITDFLRSSVTAFNDSAQASAQLEATLRSTGNAAGVTKEALDAQAEALMKNSLFDDDAITGAQSLLATFTQIKGAVFTDAIPAIADMATKMGTDMNSAAMQVGKALNDPIQGINALRRVGVSFSDDQRKVIESLVNTGRVAEAQTLILNELKTEFGGSAQAAAEAGTGPFTVLQNQFGNVQEELGGLLVQLGTELMPVLQGAVDVFGFLVSGLQSSAQWMRENEAIVKAVAIGVGIATVAWGAYSFYINAATLVTKVATAAQWLWNAALTANPIGIIIVAVGAFVGALAYLYQKTAVGRAVFGGLWEFMKALFNWMTVVPVQVLRGLGEMIVGVLTFDPTKIADGFTRAKDAFSKGAMDLAGSFKKGYREGMAEFEAEEAAKAAASKKTATAKGAAAKAGKFPGAAAAAAKGAVSGGGGDSTKGVSGTKSVTINVQIGNLIENFQQTTNNIQEGAAKMREEVARALLGAVNDFQLVGGQ